MVSLVDLSQESLSKKEIINSCRGAPAADWPPPDHLWKGRSRDLKRGLNLDNVSMGGPRDTIQGYVRLTNLWPWVTSRPDKPHWEWLIEFCSKWATALGVELEGKIQGPGRPAAPSDAMWAGYDTRKNKFTFERGELTRVSKEIAVITGLPQNTVEKKIRPAYKELKAAHQAAV